MGKPPLITDMVWETKILVNSWFTKQLLVFETNIKTKQPTVNSLNFVVDSLLHALQVVDLYHWDLLSEMLE
ncbi:hypothetical protein HanPI659440_Chr09g0329441 [Helianthus annuus]|nr:hypothetical protein HanPI659440_Chr09g0329441 [Helianthus annuus]